MKAGDLVIRVGGPFPGVERDMGIVIEMNPRWPYDRRDDELLATVLYPRTGAEAEWSEHALEVVNESR